MSLKYSITTADYMQWDEMTNLVRRLLHDKDYKMSLLIAIGCFWGLRISEMVTNSECRRVYHKREENR